MKATLKRGMCSERPDCAKLPSLFDPGRATRETNTEPQYGVCHMWESSYAFIPSLVPTKSLAMSSRLFSTATVGPLRATGASAT